MRTTRRRFLTQTSSALWGLAATGRLAAAEPAKAGERVPVIDTHLHCFAGANDPRFPYHERAPYRPPAAATPEHLLRCMDDAGVDYAVVVHPEPYQDDHRYLEHCLDVGQGRLKGTCLFFADRASSLAKLPELVQRRPGQIVAARVHAYAPDRLPPFGTPELEHLWRTAGDLGLAMQLHFEPRYAPQLEPYIRKFSSIPVVIDHMGRPFQGTPEEHAVVVRWSRLRNTVMKLAAIPQKESYPHRDIAPVIRQLVEAYGPERMIYGGGFNASATGESYRAYREQIATWLDDLSVADRAKIFGGTARKLYRFESA